MKKVILLLFFPSILFAWQPPYMIRQLESGQDISALNYNFIDLGINMVDKKSTQNVSGNKTFTGVTYGIVPTGSAIPYFGLTTNIPTGFLYCNGQAVSRTTYAGLFAVIGTVSGIGDGSTTFNLPDLRGQFLRGFDNGRGLNPDAYGVVGSTQADAAQGHTHTQAGIQWLEYDGTGTSYFGVAGTPIASKPDVGGMYIDSIYTTPRMSKETRPTSVFVAYIIKY